jgi:hypothetical protein
MVGVLLVLVVFAISLEDYCVELYILVCNGRNKTDNVLVVSIRIGFHPLVVCIRHHI